MSKIGIALLVFAFALLLAAFVAAVTIKPDRSYHDGSAGLGYEQRERLP